MAHHCKCLALGLDPSGARAGGETRFDQLQGYAATYRANFLGLVDNSHTAFSKHTEDAVRAYSFVAGVVAGSAATLVQRERAMLRRRHRYPS